MHILKVVNMIAKAKSEEKWFDRSKMFVSLLSNYKNTRLLACSYTK